MARIAGVDIPRDKRVVVSLTYIYGIGLSTAQKICAATGISEDVRVKDLTEEEVKTAMELIKEKNIFAPGGADLASLVSAKVVETDTTNYDLVF